MSLPSNHPLQRACFVPGYRTARPACPRSTNKCSHESRPEIQAFVPPLRPKKASSMLGSAPSVSCWPPQPTGADLLPIRSKRQRPTLRRRSFQRLRPRLLAKSPSPSSPCRRPVRSGSPRSKQNLFSWRIREEGEPARSESSIAIRFVGKHPSSSPFFLLRWVDQRCPWSTSARRACRGDDRSKPFATPVKASRLHHSPEKVHRPSSPPLLQRKWSFVFMHWEKNWALLFFRIDSIRSSRGQDRGSRPWQETFGKRWSDFRHLCPTLTAVVRRGQGNVFVVDGARAAAEDQSALDSSRR